MSGIAFEFLKDGARIAAEDMLMFKCMTTHYCAVLEMLQSSQASLRSLERVARIRLSILILMKIKMMAISSLRRHRCVRTRVGACAGVLFSCSRALVTKRLCAFVASVRARAARRECQNGLAPHQ